LVLFVDFDGRLSVSPRHANTWFSYSDWSIALKQIIQSFLVLLFAEAEDVESSRLF
jgi:hypothetical protein